MSVHNLKTQIDQAMGTVPADLVIKNAKVLNLATGKSKISDIAINTATGMIVGVGKGYKGKETFDAKGLHAVPGFIDTHVHIESSMITPMEFDRCVLPRGTTTAICDPHEMSNVLGEPALRYFMECSEHTIMDLFVQLSSCVPATKLETSGAVLGAAALAQFKGHRNVIGLAEFMDIGGVLGKDDEVLAKLEAFQDSHIDGHMPAGVSGRMLDAMAVCGIYNCHETSVLKDAVEKLDKGIQVLIREGTVCKDAVELTPLLTPMTSPFLGFCTDDRNPLDIGEQGHIDHVIRTVIAGGAHVAAAYRAASWSAAQGFGLHKNTAKWRRRGLVAPGWKADIVLLRDLKACDVHAVIKDGRVVSDEVFESRPHVPSIGYNSIHIKTVTPEDFALKRGNPSLQVIDLIKDSIVTRAVEHKLPVNTRGELQVDLAADILKVAVLERHGKNGNIARWFVKGFGFKEGAIAASVGHDSHNVTVVGASDADMAVAVNRLKEIQGGFTVVRGGKITGEFALPIAGLMSDKPFEAVRRGLEALQAAVSALHPAVAEPLMHMIFLPLCVIPALKLTDFGPVRFDPANGDQGPVLVEDQRVAQPKARAV